MEGAREAALSRLRRFAERLVGREPELEALVRAVRIQRFVTCSGEEGVGKSALAFAASERLAGAGTFPGGVWQLCARGVATIEVLRRAADALPPASLILIDGLDDALDSHRESVLVWLLRLLESKKEQQVLVTARGPVGLEGERVLTLDPLLESDGRRLLVGRAAVDLHPDEAGALARLLENNPRAIVLTAALLSHVPAALLRRNLEGALLKAVGHDFAPTPLVVLLGIGDDQPAATRRLLVPLGFAEEECQPDELSPRPARHFQQARRLLVQGWYEDALDASCAALDGYQSDGNAAGKAAALLLLARIAEAQEEIARAVLVLEEASAALRTLSDNEGLAVARRRQARLFTMLELPEAACAALQEARLLQPSPRIDACFAELAAAIDNDDLLPDIERDSSRLLQQGLTAARLSLNLPVK